MEKFISNNVSLKCKTRIKGFFVHPKYKHNTGRAAGGGEACLPPPLGAWLGRGRVGGLKAGGWTAGHPSLCLPCTVFWS